jgi:hypothetical protein
MRQQEVTVGGKYFAKISGDLTIVRIIDRTPYRRGRLDVFEAVNLETGRRVHVTSARLLARVTEEDLRRWMEKEAK